MRPRSAVSSRTSPRGGAAREEIVVEEQVVTGDLPEERIALESDTP